jgi:DNA repair protein SbcC/Rad50
LYYPMEILSVSLKNFKSHSDRHVVFQPGTNAICGENGAGKTSILEAIAWTLFNYRGAYRTEDLIRNGAASAQVMIAFVSSRDQRTYEISRCTRAGYTLFDPQVGEKLDYTRIEDEVMPWLRQHFGVAPGTDLGKLFANTIGVPQGTFTADFLLATEKRKPIFDTILKVEEYRQANQELLSLEKYAKVEVERLDRDIAQYDEALDELTELEPRREQLHAEIDRIQAELQQWHTQLAALQTERDRLGSQASQLQTLTAAVAQLTIRIQAQQQQVDRDQAELTEAEAAAQKCIDHREDYQAVTQADVALQALEQSRRHQQALMQQRQREADRLAKLQTQAATLTHQLATLAAARVEITQLGPLAAQQTQLEQQHQEVQHQLQTCQHWHQTIATQTTQQQQLSDRQAELQRQITATAALQSVVDQIPALEQQQHRYQQQLSRVAAAAQFEAELHRIVAQAQHSGDRHHSQTQTAAAALQDIQTAVPALAAPVQQILTTLASGSTLHTEFVTELQRILDDLKEQVSPAKLTQQVQTITALLSTARQQQAQLFKLESLLAERDRLGQQSVELTAAIAQLQTQLAGEPALQAHRAQLVQTLAELDNPKGRQQLLQRQLQAQPHLEEQQQALQVQVEGMAAAIAQLDHQLASFQDLTAQIEIQQQQRRTHHAGYQIYLEYQQLANSRRLRREQLQTTTTQLQTLQQSFTPLNEQLTALSQGYDPNQFQTIQTAYEAASHQKNYLSGSLPEMVKRLEELDRQRAKLQTVQAKRTVAQTELKRRSKVDRFIRFARKVYKEAGPRITERYVHSISHEADRLFRELLNRPNVGLEWTRDYEILVQEGAHSHRMVNLSGGEQMCAALAVRLALLKVLADIDIAFFDEPTTNMDRPRRQHLAEAIANIKTFRQLFVISHDDTFENVTENVILIEREN